MNFGIPQNVLDQIRKRHIVIWLLILIDFIFFSSIKGSFVSKLVWLGLLAVNFSFSYYALLLYIWPGVFKLKWQYVAMLLVVLFLFSGLYYLQIEMIIPKLGGTSYLEGKPVKSLLNKFLINFSYVLFASLGSYYNWNGMMRVNEEMKWERDTMYRELQFLQNQFHSHFTFNFLNFCYNKMRMHSYETALHVEQFSEILRYSLKEMPDKLIPVEKEIEFIKSYVAFQKCLTNDWYIELRIDQRFKNGFILPKIFVIFIENSLRYGIFHEPDYPVEIDIHMIDASQILFRIKNRKKHVEGFESTMNLQDIRNVLDSFYKSNYHLAVFETKETFLCELKLKNLFV